MRRRRNRTCRNVGHRAKVGIRRQHDPRAPPVFAQHVGTGADRMRTDVGTIGFDDFARHRAHVLNGEHVGEAQVGFLEPDLQRVAIDDSETE